MRRRFLIAPLLASASLVGCVTAERAPISLPATTVYAAGETEPVGTANEDAADDPAIWRNPQDPAASLIVATDKKGGLYVYGLDGKVRHFEPAGRVNNVDLIELASGMVLVAASDRNDPANARLRLYRLDAAAARLVPLGTVAAGAGEAYGLCLARSGSEVSAFSVLKDGTINQLRLDLQGATPVATTVRTLKLKSQAEGCVVDPRNGALYVGEEDVGIWRFRAGAAASSPGELVARADGRQLVADVEGLALAPAGEDGGWLVASSQGDSAFAVYALPGMEPAGRFRVGSGRFGAVEETDGIELALGSFGPDFPDGLFIAQDGINAPLAQNFKMVSWRDILDALELKP